MQKYTKSSGTVSVQLWAYFRACSQNREKWLLASSCLSVCPSLHPSAWNNSAPTGQILMIFEYFSKIFWKNPYFIKYDKNNGRLRLKRDGTCAETRFCLTLKRMSPNRWGHQFSRPLAAEVCASALVMLDTPCSKVVWEYWLPTPFTSFPLISPLVHHRVPSGFKRTLIYVKTSVYLWQYLK